MKKLAILILGGLLLTACGNSSEGADQNTEIVTTVENTSSVESNTNNDDNNVENTDVSEDAGENALMPYVDAVTNAAEWPSLAQITDEYTATEFFKLDLKNSNYNDIIIMQCPMSAAMAEVIIINADDVEQAKADLEERQKKMQDTDAFYPNDVEIANNSIVGVKGNYAYFLAGENASDSEQALIDALA